MGDEPQVTHGSRQPSGRITTDFRLNDKFIEAVGPAKAQALLDILHEVGISHIGRPQPEVEAELRRRIEAIDVAVTDPEIDGFADQISRSEEIVDLE